MTVVSQLAPPPRNSTVPLLVQAEPLTMPTASRTAEAALATVMTSCCTGWYNEGRRDLGPWQIEPAPGTVDACAGTGQEGGLRHPGATPAAFRQAAV
jgi:hypothetical protein